MGKQISEASLRKIAREELEVLEGIIDYAERMIREGNLAYRNLKRHAYGKALVIEREDGGGCYIPTRHGLAGVPQSQLGLYHSSLTSGPPLRCGRDGLSGLLKGLG